MSQLLDLRGSTFCVDAACASSIVAVHELLVTVMYSYRLAVLNKLHDCLSLLVPRCRRSFHMLRRSRCKSAIATAVNHLTSMNVSLSMVICPNTGVVLACLHSSKLLRLHAVFTVFNYRLLHGVGPSPCESSCWLQQGPGQLFVDLWPVQSPRLASCIGWQSAQTECKLFGWLPRPGRGSMLSILLSHSRSTAASSQQHTVC